MKAQHRCIVIGFGSIGQRHCSILTNLNQRVAVVSRRKLNYPLAYYDIETAIKLEDPHYIVVANETSKHEETLIAIKKTGYNNKILVEKPLFSDDPVNSFNFSYIYTGYNLRFNPLIQALHKKIQKQKVISVQTYVGQYLPTWRPGTDYTQSYSASVERGGGVIRDLSHELDYLQFLFGEWRQLFAMGGQYSDLNIETDDHFSLVYQTDKVPMISLQMNYLDHITQRFMIVNTNVASYKLDFIENTLKINDKVMKFENNRNNTYELQHSAVLNHDERYLSSYEDGLKIVKMIKMAERSSKEKVWVSND
ncbi:oxidoreductase [Bacillaceae bacterium SAS-127]|nr:oxidoreductase [Bacillaceae bacterium SAS-127]